MKFGQDQKVEFKKSFEPYCRILVRDVAKVAKISSILHGMDESERDVANNEQNFQVCLAKFGKNILAFYRIKQKLQNFMKFYKI